MSGELIAQLLGLAAEAYEPGVGSELERLTFEVADEIERLAGLVSALTDLADHARHDDGCNNPFGWKCKCGFTDAAFAVERLTRKEELE